MTFLFQKRTIVSLILMHVACADYTCVYRVALYGEQILVWEHWEHYCSAAEQYNIRKIKELQNSWSALYKKCRSTVLIILRNKLFSLESQLYVYGINLHSMKEPVRGFELVQIFLWFCIRKSRIQTYTVMPISDTVIVE